MNIKGQGHYLTFAKGHPVYQNLSGYLKSNTCIMWKFLGVVEEKIYSTGLGHMTKMAGTPIFCKNL